MITTQVYIRTFQSKEYADLFKETIYNKLKEIIQKKKVLMYLVLVIKMIKRETKL